jgi:hypothetical protein
MPEDRYRVSAEFKKLLLLEDVVDHKPEYDPYVYLARSFRAVRTLPQVGGDLEEYVGVSSCLVPTQYQEQCEGKFDVADFQFAGRGHFEDDATYVPGEQFTRKGVPFEIVVHDRFFEGLGLSYYEPTDRLVVYLGLHREEREWLNPYTRDVIIKSGDLTRGWEPHDQFLSIRHSELADYLAARKCGLLVLRYAQRILETPVQLLGLPMPFERDTTHGRQAWIVEEAPLAPGVRMYFCRLWESFWVPPASKPRRWDAEPPREFKDGVPFVLADGEMSTYGAGRLRYSHLLSFRPQVLRSFSTLPGNRVEWDCLTCCHLRYSDGSDLDLCVNSEGQIQSFFGMVAKLDVDKQRHLSGYSEPRKAKPSYEFIRTQLKAQWCETRPLGWTLSQALSEVNAPWRARFGEALLVDPEETDLPDILGPVGTDFDELPDVMLELRKALMPEGNIAKIKSGLNLGCSEVPPKNYERMGSIGYTGLLFRRFRAGGEEGTAEVLRVINDLRNCKGHVVDPANVLCRYQLDRGSPRSAYLAVLKRLCSFLAEFRSITEQALGVAVGAEGPRLFQDPWRQLDIVAAYCDRPF